MFVDDLVVPLFAVGRRDPERRVRGDVFENSQHLTRHGYTYAARGTGEVRVVLNGECSNVRGLHILFLVSNHETSGLVQVITLLCESC